MYNKTFDLTYSIQQNKRHLTHFFLNLKTVSQKVHFKIENLCYKIGLLS